MSKKTKVSSKGKKSVSKKQVVKKTAKKAVKKPAPKKTSAKPSAKKAAAKPVVKKTSPKKAAKPVVKSSSKTKKASVKKPITPKKVAKKVAPKKLKAVKPVKKAVKKVSPKKPAPKKAIKSPQPVAKASVKKSVVKTNTKPVAVVVAKPVKKAEKAAVPTKPLKTVSASVSVQKPISAPAKVVKEPAGKFEIEFVIRASAEMLYEFISTPSGLSEWFCDDVNIRNEIYSFMWEGQEQKAKVVKEIPESLIRFQWLEKMDGSYFEFRIQRDELTNDISLMITDFAPDKGEEESSRLLWNSQIDKLLHVLGAYF